MATIIGLMDSFYIWTMERMVQRKEIDQDVVDNVKARLRLKTQPSSFFTR